MLKKMGLVLSVMMALGLFITGCSNTNESQDKFQKYYDTRVQYIGDNSKVSELLNVIGAGDLGEYTIALKTDKDPYGLTVNYSKLKNIGEEEKFKNTDQINYAYFALALIENLSEVDINYDGHNYHFEIEEANKRVKGNIKDYGDSKEKLKELDDILNPEN